MSGRPNHFSLLDLGPARRGIMLHEMVQAPFPFRGQFDILFDFSPDAGMSRLRVRRFEFRTGTSVRAKIERRLKAQVRPHVIRDLQILYEASLAEIVAAAEELMPASRGMLPVRVCRNCADQLPATAIHTAPSALEASPTLSTTGT